MLLLFAWCDEEEEESSTTRRRAIFISHLELDEVYLLTHTHSFSKSSNRDGTGNLYLLHAVTSASTFMGAIALYQALQLVAKSRTWSGVLINLADLAGPIEASDALKLEIRSCTSQLSDNNAFEQPSSQCTG